MSSYVLDTHSLIWYLEGNRPLSTRARSKMTSTESHLVIPVIVLGEAAIIIERGRTKIPSVVRLLDSLVRDPRIEIYPLTLEIFELSISPQAALITELHDRLIAATVLHILNLGLDISLITQDENLTEANLVPVVW